MRWITVLFIAAAYLLVAAPRAQADECGLMPAAAVTELPQPLAKWGILLCTRYGQILTNHTGWIWSYPTAYSPVFVPSQIVTDNPAPLGANSYFTKITLTQVEGDDFKNSYEAFHYHFAPDKQMPVGYRLVLQSVSGKALILYFFDYGSSAWGIWCPSGKCDSSSRFMILDMAHHPG
jgi:hypothetical protein